VAFLSQTNKAGESVWICEPKYGKNQVIQQNNRHGFLLPPCKEASMKFPTPSFGPRTRLAGDFAAYAVVRLLVSVIQTLPLDMGDAVCRPLAWLASGPLRIRDKETQHNLQQIFPDATATERQRLSLAMWHHLLLMVCEIAWAQRRLHRNNWSKHVAFRSNREVMSYLLDDRPTVVVTGHFGNFEVGGYVTGLMGFTTLTIARRLDNVFLHRWVERFRRAKGQLMVDKEGCSAEVERHLQQGGILSLLADQHAGDKGCWVDFLGVPASCHKALALFSLSSNAPMLVGSTRRLQGQPMQLELAVLGVADPANDPDGCCRSVTTLTHWYNQKLAAVIEPAVEQYWWLHRRWRTPPERIAKKMQKAA
jgi:Kdo2-lipid IVA lauroyltransferase/acyltransferase